MPREIHFFYDQLWSGVLDEGRRVAQLGIEFVHRPVKVLGEGDTEAFKRTGRKAESTASFLPPEIRRISSR